MRVKDGKLIDKPSGRPLDWSGERLLQLLEAVQREKKKSGLTKDLDALGLWGASQDRNNGDRAQITSQIRLAASSMPGFAPSKVAYMTRSNFSANWMRLTRKLEEARRLIGK